MAKILYDEFFNAHLTKEANAKTIKHLSKDVLFMQKQWNKFIEANQEMVLLISNATTLELAIKLAKQWYDSVIRLAKWYYNVKELTEQIYNNRAILLMDLVNGNLARLERTYINTFTNVAKYQVIKDVV